MDNKISLPQLAKTLSGKLGISQKEAEAFLREFFESVSHNVLIDKVVKIKGFGTFKLIEVQDRESVNVNTGERIVIPGHSKISFTPDATLKDIVNKPFADFQTVIINDGTSLEDMERMDLVEPLPVLSDEEESESAEEQEIATNDTESIAPSYTEETEVEASTETDDSTVEAETEGGSDVDVDQEPELVSEKNSAIEPSTEAEEPMVETATPDIDYTTGRIPAAPVTTPSNDIKQTEDTILQNLNSHEPEEDSQQNANEDETEDASIQHPKMNTSEGPFMRFLQSLAIAFIILLLMGGSYYAGYHHILCPEMSPCHQTDGQYKDSIDQNVALLRDSSEYKVNNDSLSINAIDNNQLSTIDSAKTDVDIIAVLKSEKEATAQEEAERQAQEAAAARQAEETAARKAAEAAKKAATPQYRAGARYRIVGTLKTHKLQYGEYLNRIAYREYGNKEFVRYIVIHNNLENPDNIPIGTIIKLPKLEEIK